MADDTPSPLKSITVSTNAGIPAGTVVSTPEGMPNLVVKTKTPLKRTVVRIARVYVQSLVGFLPITLGAGQAIANQIAPGQMVLPTQFGSQIVLAASLALAPAVTTLLGNLLEFLVKEDAA
jgi:hypothetical protein